MNEKRPARRWGDRLFGGASVGCAALALLLMAGLFFEIASGSAPALSRFGAGFVASAAWDPVQQDFGALSSIFGTLVSTFIALLIAVPLSLVIALFLVELAPPIIARPVGLAIELLAAIPSIIYGMWGLFVFAPWLSEHLQPFLQELLGEDCFLVAGPPIGIGMLPAGIILAFMVLPYTSSVMRDVFQMVPPVVKEAAHGMGSTTWEATRRVTMRYGIQGLVGAIFLGLGRAVGETMAVTFVIGNEHRLSGSLFAPGNTIASTLANEFNEASEPLYRSSLFALGLTLLVMTLLIQVATHLWLRRIKRKMGAGL